MLETSFELETSGLRAEVKKKALREGLREGRKKGLEEGLKEGRKEGKIEGKVEGKLEIALSMLKEGLEMPLVKKITGLKEKQIIEYGKQVKI